MPTCQDYCCTYTPKLSYPPRSCKRPKSPGAFPETPAPPRRCPPPAEAGPAPSDGDNDTPAPTYPILPVAETTTTKTKVVLSTIPEVEPKLGGLTNYAAWMIRMENILFMFDLSYGEGYSYWEIVKGVAKIPSESETETKNRREWRKADCFALLTMQKNCEADPLSKIEMCGSANEAYQALKSQYEGMTATDLAIIVKRVFQFPFDDRTTTIGDHITEFDKRWGFMKSTVNAMMITEANKENKFYKGIQLCGESDEAKAEFLLLTMPPFYSQLVQNLRVKTGYTYGDITRGLIRYVPGKSRRSVTIGREEYKTGSGSGAKASPVLLAPTDRLRKPVDTSKQCGYCQKVKKWRGLGHTENECSTKQKERGNQ